jgi:hypothetical protein
VAEFLHQHLKRVAVVMVVVLPQDLVQELLELRLQVAAVVVVVKDRQLIVHP